jgi:hypothetical protein
MTICSWRNELMSLPAFTEAGYPLVKRRAPHNSRATTRALNDEDRLERVVPYPTAINLQNSHAGSSLLRSFSLFP